MPTTLITRNAVHVLTAYLSLGCVLCLPYNYLNVVGIPGQISRINDTVLTTFGSSVYDIVGDVASSLHEWFRPITTQKTATTKNVVGTIDNADILKRDINMTVGTPIPRNRENISSKQAGTEKSVLTFEDIEKKYMKQMFFYDEYVRQITEETQSTTAVPARSTMSFSTTEDPNHGLSAALANVISELSEMSKTELGNLFQNARHGGVRPTGRCPTCFPIG